MSIGKILFVTFALLAYMSQSLAFAGVNCAEQNGPGELAHGHPQMQVQQAMGGEHAGHMSSHSQMDMSATPSDAPVADCCAKDCQCPQQGCHSAVPLLAITSLASSATTVPRQVPTSAATLSFSSSLYKPPISA